MIILSIYKYYWPDTAPYGNILKVILEKLSQHGHETSVITAQPSYSEGIVERRAAIEYINGVNIVRIAVPKERKGSVLLRLPVFVFFMLKAYSHISRNKCDLIVVNSFPPVLMGLYARFIKWIKKIPYIYHCQDIHPESLLLAGFLRNGLIYKILRNMDMKNCLKASAVVTLSEDMAETLNRRGMPEGKVHILNNFIQYNGNADAEINIFAKSSGSEFNILYAGNMGHFQGLENVIAAANLVSGQTSEVRFFFMGAGSAKNALTEAAGRLLNNTVFFIPFQPPDVALAAMRNSDFGIVSLKEKIYEVAFPSKTMAYLSAGCPILLITEKESKLAGFVIENGLGAVSSSDPEEIAKVIMDVFHNRASWQEKRLTVQQVGLREFGKEQTLKKWVDLIETIK